MKGPGERNSKVKFDVRFKKGKPNKVDEIHANNVLFDSTRYCGKPPGRADSEFFQIEPIDIEKGDEKGRYEFEKKYTDKFHLEMFRGNLIDKGDDEFRAVGYFKIVNSEAGLDFGCGTGKVAWAAKNYAGN